MRVPASVGLAAIIAAGLLATALGDAVASDPKSTPYPVLLELFTSQGCSSCPPADKLAGRLAREPGFIVLTRPITYWDGLGWKDTLAREENTTLQRAYSRTMGRGGRVYTPQVVIGGAAETVGSREKEIRSLAGKAEPDPDVHLAVKSVSGGAYGVGLAGKTSKQAELMLVAIDPSEAVAIGRGENTGRTVTYTNVVRGERRLGSWDGGVASFPVGAKMLITPGADRYALVLRVTDGGPVLVTRMLP